MKKTNKNGILPFTVGMALLIAVAWALSVNKYETNQDNRKNTPAPQNPTNTPDSLPSPSDPQLDSMLMHLRAYEAAKADENEKLLKVLKEYKAVLEARQKKPQNTK